MSTEHTSKQFDAELEALRARVLQMGGLVEEQIKLAVDALVTGDHDRCVAIEGSPGIDGSRWQLRWHNGAVLEKWADPAYEGWNLGAPATHLDSPCSDATVERVVLNLGSEVLDELSPAEDWAAAIDATNMPAAFSVRTGRDAMTVKTNFLSGAANAP